MNQALIRAGPNFDRSTLNPNQMRGVSCVRSLQIPAVSSIERDLRFRSRAPPPTSAAP